MAGRNNKILGEKRRQFVLRWLKESDEPITASTLAERANVSRQVIVQDISLLKARNHPIVATSQGYVYMDKASAEKRPTCIVAVRHLPEETEDELNIMVDHGVFVRDVIVEHPVYGEITASLMLRNRRDVSKFIERVKETNAAYLLELTAGLHLHTLEAESADQLDEVCQALDKAGYLVSSSS